MASGITMRELQKISASTIAALPHGLPIQNGNRTIGFLVPLKPHRGGEGRQDAGTGSSH